MNLAAVEKLSPVKIEYVNKSDFYGRYNLLQYCITINADEDKSIQSVTLLHEIGHAICHKNNCRCYTQEPRNVFLREYHAFKYTMEHVVGHIELINTFVLLVTKVLRYDNWPNHQLAVKKLMKLKQWKKFCKIIEIK